MLSADGKPVSPSEVRLKHQAGSKDIEIVVAPGQSGPAERTDLMLADIQLTNGRTLFARNRTGGAIDPLSAPLARAEFCRLWQHGSFYLNIGLRDQAHTGAPPLNLLDMAKADGMAVFAAEVCNGGRKPPSASYFFLATVAEVAGAAAIFLPLSALGFLASLFERC